jgi:ribose-phosphate pyrophosphokinase
MSVLVFGTRSYSSLAEAVCRAGGFEPGESAVASFPDGERDQRLLSSVHGRDTALVGGTISDEDTLELYDLASGLVACGANRVSLVIPYFGYSTMERAVRPGEIVGAKTRAVLLSSIPRPPGGLRVFLLDLHSEGLPYYFEGGITPVHVYAKRVVLEAIRRLGGDECVVGCVDAGRAKWVQSLADDLGVPASFVFKRRLTGERTEVTVVSAHVENRTVVVYDDMIRTGGSLLAAAEAYQQAGASRVAAMATHGVFPGEALARLEASGRLTALVTTDAHPRAVALQGGFLSVVSVAPILAQALIAS